MLEVVMLKITLESMLKIAMLKATMLKIAWEYPLDADSTRNFSNKTTFTVKSLKYNLADERLKIQPVKLICCFSVKLQHWRI